MDDRARAGREANQFCVQIVPAVVAGEHVEWTAGRAVQTFGHHPGEIAHVDPDVAILRPLRLSYAREDDRPTLDHPLIHHHPTSLGVRRPDIGSAQYSIIAPPAARGSLGQQPLANDLAMSIITQVIRERMILAD